MWRHRSVHGHQSDEQDDYWEHRPAHTRGDSEKDHRTRERSVNKEKRSKGLLDRISFRALNISVKGRLKGVRRARRVKVHFRGTRPNSFAQPEHSKQLPIKTKWGILSMTLALN